MMNTSALGRQKAFYKGWIPGVEMSDYYGDLTSTWDVIMAWLKFSAICQKLFPDWPVAIIILRTIFTIKLFQHRGRDDICERFNGLDNVDDNLLSK